MSVAIPFLRPLRPWPPRVDCGGSKAARFRSPRRVRSAGHPFSVRRSSGQAPVGGAEPLAAADRVASHGSGPVESRRATPHTSPGRASGLSRHGPRHRRAMVGSASRPSLMHRTVPLQTTVQRVQEPARPALLIPGGPPGGVPLIAKPANGRPIPASIAAPASPAPARGPSSPPLRIPQ